MRYLLYVLAGLILVVIVAVAGLALFVDPNAYRDDIARVVEEKTGRALTIEGDLHLSVFPWLGIRTGPLALANPPGFGDEPMLRVEGAEIRVKLLPLLHKQVELDRIVLAAPRIHLIKDAGGRGNWEFSTGETRPSAPAEKSTRPQPLPALVIGGLTIKDGEIFWEDRQSGKKIQLAHVNLDLGDFEFGRPADLALGFVLTLPQAHLKETLALETRLTVGADLQRFELAQLEVHSHSEGESLPGKQLRAELSAAAIIADLTRQTLEARELLLSAAKAQLRGELEGSTIVDAPKFQGKFQLEAPLKETLTALAVAIAPADPKAMQQLQLAFKLQAERQNMAIDALQAKLDDTTLGGWLKVTNFAHPFVRFDLKADTLDVNRYLPKPALEPAGKAAAAPKAALEKPLPLAALAAQRVDGVVRIDRLKAQRLQIQNVRLKLKGDHGIATLTPSLQLYQGRYQGRLQIDARRKTPHLALTSQLEQVKIGNLLQDYLAKQPPLTGTADLNLNLRADGQTETALKRSLDGRIALQVQNGRLANSELLQMLEQGLAWWQARGESVQVAEKLQQLDFVTLDFLANMDDGVIQTERLLIDNPKLKITGTGTVDLVRERLDYRIRALHTSGNRKPGSKLGKIARDLPIIVRIEGPLAKPKYRLDLVQMAQEKFREKIEKKKAKLEQKLGEKLEKKLGPGAGQLLKGLFGP
ncbi:AsmA protein [Methylomarinovum caldicuralii]|uniref:AsmA protein n=1 Tax=Methylomarinovum caldicuralii TaxID=438856 RepID=A0AAU9CMG3_9GAMM|nr:AsmA family protein [Methylomarinovum caldicuralii]BCX81068.1 AsmA protein [Methylomarinovum caldicuralii]